MIAWLLRMVPAPVWVVAVLILSSLCAWQEIRIAGYRVEAEAAEMKLAKTQIQFNRERMDAIQATRAHETALQAAADKARIQRDDQINRLRADVRSLRDRVQYLPARPAEPQASSAGEVARECDGPVLYREVGQELVNEAERADTIRIELLRVYQLWDEARQLNNQQ